MLKMEKEYKEKYGDIPYSFEDRMAYLYKSIGKMKQKDSILSFFNHIYNIPWKTIGFTIYLLPKATPRPRSGKYGTFYVKGAKDNHKFFESYIKDKNMKLITTPTKFTCITYFPIPQSMSKLEKIAAEWGLIRPTSKPDWDNVGKAYCDMIQQLLIYDDALIVEGTSKKYYSVKPRIEITLSYMEDYDCNFNKRKIVGKE